MGRSAIFLDRDGVLNENRADYVRSWNEFAFLPGTFPALRALATFGAPIVIVTNQAGVGRGLISHTAIEDIHHRMTNALSRRGVRIDGIYWCPHTVDDDCQCRKPKPGMLLGAAAQLGIDLSTSVIVGDAETDIQAGQQAGCSTVLVLTGRGRAAAEAIRRGTCGNDAPNAIVDDLRAAVPVVRQLLASHSTRTIRWSRLRHSQPSPTSDELASNGMPIGKG